MAQAGRDRGLKYLGIADHSRSAGYAGGLSIECVRSQWAEIDTLNESFGGEFHIFKGTNTTSCWIAPSITPMSCSTVSITSWRASIRASSSRASR